MSTNNQQPKWLLIGNLGDKTPLIHGGLFVYKDLRRIYTEEACLIQPKGGFWLVYRFILDRLKIEAGYLVPFKFDSTWPYSVDKYGEWFDKDLFKVADSMGTDLLSLRQSFCSEDPFIRARAYESIGNYHGFNNLDDYPVKYTSIKDLRKRFNGDLRRIKNQGF